MKQPPVQEAIYTPEFLARLARSDPDAVALLCREHAGHLMDFLQQTRHRHRLPESSWADVVQEVFVRFLQNPPAIDQRRPLGPLLRVIALNEARDQAKAVRRRRAHEGNVAAASIPTAAGAENAGNALIAVEDRRLVEGKLRLMSEQDRQALMSYVKAGPNAHVAALAQEAGMNTGAAQMRFGRAKKRWGEMLGQDGNEGQR